jgi:hypothetical protein
VSRPALPLVVRFGERAISDVVDREQPAGDVARHVAFYLAHDLPESATVRLETDIDRRVLDPVLPIGGQVQAHAQLWLGVS